MRIALDAMGGDFAPQATVEGAILAARDLKLDVILVGQRPVLEAELAKHKTKGLMIAIEEASEVVTMDDSPLESVVTKPHSSIHVGFEMLKRGEVAAFISAGNSGAMMTAALVLLGNLPGIDRPAIATLVPTASGHALLIDAGANTEIKAHNLAQFALMGSAYMHYVRGVERPRVGVLSNGEEDSKGTEVTRAAAAILRQMPHALDFVGYVEGRDINQGKIDVIATDGFTGNVTLKTMEGFARFLLGNLRGMLESGVRGRLAYLMIRKRLGAMRKQLDPSEYGGAPLLGVNGVAMIAHGSSNPIAIRNALRAAANEALSTQLNRAIVELVSHMPYAALARVEGKGIRAIFNRMRERLHRRHKEGEGPLGTAEGRSEGGKGDTGSLVGVIKHDAAPSLNGTAPSAEEPRHVEDGQHKEEPRRAREKGGTAEIGLEGHPADSSAGDGNPPEERGH